MEKINRELLIKDIISRLFYGVYVKFRQYNKPLCLSTKENLTIINGGENSDDIQYLYLRPMSSMTPEEKKVYQSKQDFSISYHYEFGDIVDDYQYFDNYDSLDYLNSIHVDYRGLIPMGLALPAKEDMYNLK